MARGDVTGRADQGEVFHFKAGYRRWGELGLSSLFSIPIVISRMFPVRVRSAISRSLRRKGGSNGVFETDHARHRQRAKKETLNGGRHATAR